MAISLLNQELSNEQQALFSKLIYDRTGIAIPLAKKMLLAGRLKRRMRALEIGCFDKYFNHLKKLSKSDREWEAFLQEITTHETYLFRDASHWSWLRETFLPGIHAEVKNDPTRHALRIWSAACSTGDEAYTIACCCAEEFGPTSKLKVEIFGTDIGVGALEKAKAAVFSERAVRLVPSQLREKHFKQNSDKTWSAKLSLKQMVSFQSHNLMEPLRVKAFDLIFVKNVLIYFDNASKLVVMNHIDRALKTTGLLVTGPAEGIAGFLPHYRRIKPWLHQKSDR